MFSPQSAPKVIKTLDSFEEAYENWSVKPDITLIENVDWQQRCEKLEKEMVINNI